MQLEEKQQLISYLGQFVTHARWEKIVSVLQQRTRHITVILEDIYQPHNASAVLRSCDSFGVQDVHIIENKNIFTITQGVSVGSDRWLTLYRYNQQGINNTQECLKRLRSEGYIIAATTPHTKQITIEELSVNTKVALMFGSEINGLSEYAQNNADVSVKIPMQGFSESFNISVSVALCLYDLTNRLRRQHNNWELTETEKLDLELNWLRKSIKAGELIEKKFMRKKEEGRGKKRCDPASVSDASGRNPRRRQAQGNADQERERRPREGTPTKRGNAHQERECTPREEEGI